MSMTPTFSCPSCGGRILATARRCRHCDTALHPPATLPLRRPDADSAPTRELESARRARLTLLGLLEAREGTLKRDAARQRLVSQYPKASVACPKCRGTMTFATAQRQSETRELAHGRYRKDGGLDRRYNSSFRTVKWHHHDYLCGSCEHRWEQKARQNPGCLSAIAFLTVLPAVAIPWALWFA